MMEFEFSIACMSNNHSLCEWCACWCHMDDGDDPEANIDEFELQHYFDVGGEGGEW